MAGKGSKVAGFTRGGVPVNAHPEGGGAQGPRRRKSGTGGRNFGPGEIGAIGLAGALTAGAGALIVGGMRKGVGKR